MFMLDFLGIKKMIYKFKKYLLNIQIPLTQQKPISLIDTLV